VTDHDGVRPVPGNALQRLIAEVKASSNDISYARLAERAGFQDDGTPWIQRQQIQKFATLPLKRPPRDAAVVGLARALRVTESTVRAAVGESLRYRDPLPGDRANYTFAHALADRIDGIDDGETRSRVLWAVERLVRAVEPAVEPQPVVLDELSELSGALLDALPRMDDTQRRRLLALLDEVADGDVRPGGGEDDEDDEDG
jgi:hypothetical protein